MVNVSLMKATALSYLEGLIRAERDRATAAENAIIGSNIGVPIGGLVIFSGTAAPENFLLCRGQAVSRELYEPLFAVIGTTYGAGDGSTTFNVPDTRGRVPVGAGNGGSLTDRALGATGGSETHQLSAGEIPAHNHAFSGNTSESGAHTHGPDGGGAFLLVGTGSGPGFDSGNSYFPTRSVGQTLASGAHTHSFSGNTENRGGGGSHNNMQPFLGLNFIIRAL